MSAPRYATTRAYREWSVSREPLPLVVTASEMTKYEPGKVTLRKAGTVAPFKPTKRRSKR